MITNIEIKEMPKTDWAFVTHIGVEGLDAAYGKLLQWAIPKGLVGNDLKMGRIYHDSFKITDPAKVRMSACVLLQEPIQTNGEIGLVSIPKGKYIVGHFEIPPHEFGKSWQSLFIWMKENGFSEEELKQGSMVKIFGLTFVFSLFLALMMHFLCIHQFGPLGMIGGPDFIETAKPSYAAFMLDYGDAYRTYQHGALHGFMSGLFLALPLVPKT